ncbi:MAG: TetR/AcrR family transcriptional regulator [Bacillota bacterium]
MPTKNTQTAKAQGNGETRGLPDTTRERLLLVAEELFAKKGFAGTSIREIGAALGIANSSIMYYFPSKKKLYAAVLMRIADSINPVINDLPEDSGDASEQLRVMMERLMAWAQANTGYLQIIVRELMEVPDRLAHARQWYLAGVVEAMRLQVDKMKDKGKLTTIDPALFLIHLIGSITYFYIARPTVSQITGNRDLEELNRKYKETVLQVIDACITADSR